MKKFSKRSCQIYIKICKGEQFHSSRSYTRYGSLMQEKDKEGFESTAESSCSFYSTEKFLLLSHPRHHWHLLFTSVWPLVSMLWVYCKLAVRFVKCRICANGSIVYKLILLGLYFCKTRSRILYLEFWLCCILCILYYELLTMNHLSYAKCTCVVESFEQSKQRKKLQVIMRKLSLIIQSLCSVTFISVKDCIWYKFCFVSLLFLFSPAHTLLKLFHFCYLQGYIFVYMVSLFML